MSATGWDEIEVSPVVWAMLSQAERDRLKVAEYEIVQPPGLPPLGQRMGLGGPLLALAAIALLAVMLE